jgi:hypothetical protein
MSKQRLIEIATSLNDLSYSLNDGLLGQYADEIAVIAATMPDPVSPDDVCTDCDLKRRTHPVECCSGFTG